MCILCTEQMKKLTIKERLSASTEMLREASGDDVNHITDVWNEALSDYADEISKEVNSKQYDQLTFADYIWDWES